jgi:putative inorganic carbon (hco3(-)) transporter
MRTITLLLVYYGCVLYSLANPLFGLLFFIHITIFRPESLVWGNLVFGRLHLITACIVLLAYFVRERGAPSEIDQTYSKNTIVIFFLFVLWLFVVTILAENSVYLSFAQTLEVAKIFVVCFLFAKLINSEHRINLYVWVVSVSFGLLSFWGFLQGLLGNPRLDTLWPGGSNYIAAQLALMGPVSLATTLDTALPRKSRAVFLACTVSIVLCCIYTGSRGAFLGLIVGALMLILRIKQRMRGLIGLAVIVPVVSLWVPQDYSERIASISEEKRDASAESRLIAWKIALRIWQDHPIAGVGLENFSPVKEDYADEFSDIVTSQELRDLIFNTHRYPHGLYQGLMAETGLVGIGLFITLLLRSAFCRFPSQFMQSENGRSLNLQAKGAQAGLIGFAAAAVFGDFQYLETFYLQLFLVASIRGYADALMRHPRTLTSELQGAIPVVTSGFSGTRLGQQARTGRC